MTVTADHFATAVIDDVLRMIVEAKHDRHPIETLEDRLLDMRLALAPRAER